MILRRNCWLNSAGGKPRKVVWFIRRGGMKMMDVKNCNKDFQKPEDVIAYATTIAFLFGAVVWGLIISLDVLRVAGVQLMAIQANSRETRIIDVALVGSTSETAEMVTWGREYFLLVFAVVLLSILINILALCVLWYTMRTFGKSIVKYRTAAVLGVVTYEVALPLTNRLIALSYDGTLPVENVLALFSLFTSILVSVIALTFAPKELWSRIFLGARCKSRE